MLVIRTRNSILLLAIQPSPHAYMYITLLGNASHPTIIISISVLHYMYIASYPTIIISVTTPQKSRQPKLVQSLHATVDPLRIRFHWKRREITEIGVWNGVILCSRDSQACTKGHCTLWASYLAFRISPKTTAWPYNQPKHHSEPFGYSQLPLEVQVHVYLNSLV